MEIHRDRARIYYREDICEVAVRGYDEKHSLSVRHDMHDSGRDVDITRDERRGVHVHDR